MVSSLPMCADARRYRRTVWGVPLGLGRCEGRGVITRREAEVEDPPMWYAPGLSVERLEW